MAFEYEAFESGEGYESEAFNEWAEAAKKKGPKTASGKGLAPVPVSKNFVTFTDLRSALDKVGGQIKTNSDAIGTVGAKVSSMSATLKKEAEDRKKEQEALKKDTNSKIQMMALLPLLMPPPSYTVPVNAFAAGVPAAVTTLNPPATSTMNALLPFLLLGGFGTSGTGTSDGGGMDNTMLLALMLTLQNR